MKKIPFSLKSIWAILLFNVSCVAPYEPPIIENGVSILVVDGSLNTAGESVIRLTRTQNISDAKTAPVELKASVSFISDDGSAYALTEVGNGNYSLPAQVFDITKQYRLNIRTADQKEYASEFVPVTKSPAIDSVTWKVTSDKGVQIYVSTHDAESTTRFFRWSFDETWKYTAAYNSNFEWSNGEPILRKENIYVCYRTAASGKIVIGNTEGLSEDIISEHPLQYLDQRNEKIRYKYSVLVKQYALSKNAYDYWLQLQKNTESLGTLFDPQPSQLTGNITCISDPTESVLGYFVAGSTSEKRIFISSDNLPRARTYITAFDGCSADTLQVRDIPRLRPKELSNIYLLDPLPSGPGPILRYSTTTAACADCRAAGGSVTKPNFWQ